MGATQWSHFAPYQSDINKALQQLKVEVFKQGEYELPSGFDQHKVGKQVDQLAAVYQSLPEEIREQTDQFMELARAATKQNQPRSSLKSDEHLLKRCGTEGAHSILDIDRISPEPAPGVITPLPREKLLCLFVTEQPTREMILSSGFA